MPRTNRQSHSVPTDGKIVRRNLGDDERQKVYRLLLERSVEGKLKHGTIAIVLRIVGCHWRTVSRLWAQARASIDKGSLVADVAVKRKGNPGAKSRRSSDEVEEAKSVALDDRQTLRSTAEKSGIPKTTILRHMKTSSILRARSNHVKPILTTKNQVWRVRHAMSLLLPQLCGGHIFANMRDFVHIDEKWFNITKVKRRFYAYNNEALALRRVQSTKFITKVCAGNTTYSPLKKHGAGPGKKVGVIGIGGLGHLEREGVQGALGSAPLHPEAVKAYAQSFDILLCTSYGPTTNWDMLLSLVATLGTFVLVGLPEKPITDGSFSLVPHKLSFVGSLIRSPSQIEERL
ncbi:hypothetical protein Ae201684P_007221 [Aphanomyces euteiches]|uniref:DUF7769 domain-containing protein n=1 Tax=Aphanomyces euteiches TaxID=100861 RepID=A0A6G0W6D2_9STRA|nr:hypothetical protein Ae201684_019047 [Aphanomyces euteiches]KAH9101033.1 hypothetical protein Ae201684P_007221 [Aphanomyces euteiches]